MKIGRNAKIAVAASAPALTLAASRFGPLATWSATRSKVREVTLLDTSGRPLTSLFDGLQVDPLYPEFKRLAAERRHKCSGPPSQTARLWLQVVHLGRLLGISSDFAVHAQGSCQGCGYQIVNYVKCAESCGGADYDGDLEDAPCNKGIYTGPTVCTEGDCQGEVKTSNGCDCLGNCGDDDDDEEE